MSNAATLYYGRPEFLPGPMFLRAGPLSMTFDPANGFIRHVRLGDHEVVRAVYGAIRDEKWATIPAQLLNISSEIADDSFRITFDVACREREIDYFWQGSVSGEASGKVTYTFRGEAKSKFLRNRIGLCVLHPITECAGKACTIEHIDGSVEEGTFPQNIAPVQPFFDIRTVVYPVATTGARVEIRCEGETFEMEDQRNWGDASFKTYSTPQRLPKPAIVNPGDKVLHTVTIQMARLDRPILPVLQGRAPQFSIATTGALALPPLGSCVPIPGLRLNHLRVDLDLTSDFIPVLERAAGSGLGLHVAIELSRNPEPELQRLGSALSRIKPPVLLWLVYARDDVVPSEELIRAAQPALQECAPNALTAAGTREWFVDWNTRRPAKNYPALIAFAAQPQIHQRDNLTMVENLSGLAYAADSAKEFSAKPVVYSPISLGSPNDPRELSLFGAGWLLGSIVRLAHTGNVHSLTYALKLKDQDRVSPAYHVLADIMNFGATKLFATHSSHPLLTEALTMVNPRGARRILIASYSEQPLEARIKTGQVRASIRYLDETNCETAMKSPEAFQRATATPAESVAGKIELKLAPFAIARVDLLT